ncbi:[Pyruvate dehydrogenase (acetyl-transferring)] kinase 2, mitochondrial [Madurella mycetomatis]|uniref:Protein-serine/threonine kinase n=1 Tax=Madurella mycetomatis TaxID=100816 RepID=A0A175VQI0_9PEZI|nr:[Pyruvate dehydrogenase (acetyl-transferring)] kinase 2, mitochondrial [Madurella mycetomatis]KXX74155.1 [Pyruvate dehydrogenase (acetyl-transferring)] kinase 2, mitochondrial [Madurella mycetomatis]
MLRSSLQHAATPARLVRRAEKLCMAARAQYSHDHSPRWRPMSVLDEWVAKEARPISLRQLMVFGRSLTEPRLISSANYVRTELPTRIAHRIRDMQILPYKVVTNQHMNEVYDLYYTAFDTFRRVREIKSLEDNDHFCKTIRQMLKAHLTVIPKLAMGVLECNDMMDPSELDKFMNTILRSRISRRVIAEQHLALTDTFHARFSPGAKRPEVEFIGEVFLKCVAKDVVERCGATIREIAQRAYGPDVILPEIRIDGHLDANFPYILSHLEYIIGELLRNSVQAVVEKHQRSKEAGEDDVPPQPPPIEVTICESQQHVIIRICDRGGGIPREKLPYLWSFTKGPASDKILANLGKVPKMAATMQELREEGHQHKYTLTGENQSSHSGGGGGGSSSSSSSSSCSRSGKKKDGEDAIGTDVHSSLASLTSRPPNLRLGMGLPLSRVYAEYWAGSLSLHSLAGYGVDAFLQVSKLGNKNEQLTTRASMDAV